MKSTSVASSAPAIRHDHAPALSVVWQSRWGLPIGYAVSSEALALELLSRGVELDISPDTLAYAGGDPPPGAACSGGAHATR